MVETSLVEVEVEVGVEVEVKVRAQNYFFGMGGWLGCWMVGDFNNYDSCTCFNYGICITDGCLLHWIKWLQRAIIVVLTVIPIMAVVVKMCIVFLDNIVIMLQ